MSPGFFRSVWRFNALAIALCGVIGVFVGLFAAYHVAREVFRRPYVANDLAHVAPAKSAANTDPAKTGPQVAMRVGHFTRLRGTPIMMAQVNATETYDYGSSSKVANSARNVIFYDIAIGSSRRLLPDDTKLVLSTSEVRAETDDASRAPRALIHRLIEADSNKDGLLNANDGATLALSNADGSALTRIDIGGSTTISHTLTADASAIVIMVGSSTETKALHVDATTFKVIRTDTLTSPP